MIFDSLSSRNEGFPIVPVAPTNIVKLFNKKVMVCLPWQKHSNPMTSYCVTQIMDRRRTSSGLNFGDAFVVHTRNSLADHFLKSECEFMLTIDDDMLIPFGNSQWYNAFTGFRLKEPFAGYNALDRLMSHGKSLIGALYFGRYPGAKAVFCEAMSIEKENDYARTAPIDIIKPTKWVGTGCMLVHRKVFEDIEKRFPRLARGQNGLGGQWFTSTEASLLDYLDRARKSLSDGPLSGEKAYEALRILEEANAVCRNENALGDGEDVSFCKRAMAAGHTPYVDMGLVCGHIGHCVYGPKNTGIKQDA